MSKMTQVALERLCKAMTVNPECHDLVSIALSAATRIERLETEKIPQLNISLAKASLRIDELERDKKALRGIEENLREHIDIGTLQLSVATARIAELEAENIRLGIEYRRMRLALGDIAINSKRALKESPTDQLTAHSDIERQDDKSSNDTQTDTFVYGKECEE